MAEYSVKDNIAIIALRNGKFNPLSQNTRASIVSCLNRALKDDAIKAVVLCGGQKHFSVGADISEFGDFVSVADPHLVDVCEALDASTKPVVAAVRGYALGGGFELVLACQYRIANSDAIVGFPEVKLGILPGAGGTQRFPRLAGLDAAMEWITKGKQYSASTAAKLGIFDRIVPKTTDVISETIVFAKIVATKSFIGKRASDRTPKGADKADEIAAKHLQIIHKKSRGQYAPVYCIQAIRHATQGTFADGLRKEAELLDILKGSGQARSLTYSFFAERQVQKWMLPGTNVSWHNTKPMPVKLGAVIGLGTMGRGIVINFLRAGIPVIVSEMNEKFLDSGLKSVYSIIDDMERHKSINSQQNLMMKSAVTGTLDYSDMKDVDLVIEAVFEDITLKEKVFKALDKHCKPSAILATNTSALNIDDIASFTRRPDKVMGMHFFAPANLMRLLENINGAKTSAETVATCMEMGKKMAKVTVLVGNCLGFVGNRMYFNYMNEADFLLEEGGSPESVDKALTDYGFTMGRYVVADLSGNDLGYRMRGASGLTARQQSPGTKENVRQGMRYCPLADYICEKGRYGLKSGRGWYDYSKRIPIHSAEVAEIIKDYRKRVGVVPRRIDHEEILERTLYSMINEGFKILDDGYAATPMDVDMVWIHGYAWPNHTGGPMYYAGTVGLPKVLERVRYYHDKFGDAVPHWTPSEMLTRLVRERGNPDISEWMQYSSANMGKKNTKSNL